MKSRLDALVIRRRLRACAFTVATTVFSLLPPAADAAEKADELQATYVTKSIRGHVVWLADAMWRLHGVKSVPEAADRMLALETDDGRLHPIVEDVRGRAFRRDERLRKMNVELLVRQYRDSPLVQVIRVHELTKDGMFEIDYWCEICAIVMYELKDCECCQGPIELRWRPTAAPK